LTFKISTPVVNERPTKKQKTHYNKSNFYDVSILVHEHVPTKEKSLWVFLCKKLTQTVKYAYNINWEVLPNYFSTMEPIVLASLKHTTTIEEQYDEDATSQYMSDLVQQLEKIFWICTQNICKKSAKHQAGPTSIYKKWKGKNAQLVFWEKEFMNEEDDGTEFLDVKFVLALQIKEKCFVRAKQPYWEDFCTNTLSYTKPSYFGIRPKGTTINDLQELIKFG
jgi:hypothetical protein